MGYEKNRSCVQRELRVCVLSNFCHVQLFVTLWTVAHKVPLSMGFYPQEYWSGLPFPPPGNLPNTGVKWLLLHWREVLYY